MDDNLKWLIKWFHSQCNGKWENEKTVSIGTLDNPGWWLDVRINGTELQNRSFQTVNDVERSEHNWIACCIRDGAFQGCGGPFNFPNVLQIFRDWAEGSENKVSLSPIRFELTHVAEHPLGYLPYMNVIQDDFIWLTTWFYSQCNGDWEHGHTILINNTDGINWYFRVNADFTQLMDQPFQDVNVKRSETDWFRCCIDRQYFCVFEGYGGPFNLPEMIRVFRDWAQSVYSTVSSDERY